MTLDSLEARIKTDWNVARAWVALHPYSTLAIAVVLGWVAGRFV